MIEKINEDRLSLVKRYPLETAFLLVILWCGWLQYQVIDLNKTKERYISTDRERMLHIIEQNTSVISTTNQLIDKNNDLFEEMLRNGIQQNNISYQPGQHTGKGKQANR